MNPSAPRSDFGRAFAQALQGIARTVREEPNFRYELTVAAAAVALSLWLQTGTTVVLLCCALVLTSELINTAVERLADALHPAAHPLVGAAKDAAAGAVALSAAFSVAIGLWALGPALLARVQGWLS